MGKTIYLPEYKFVLSKLKQARLEAGLTQEEVAAKLKKPQSYISKVENGERRLDVVELKLFADLYKRKVDYFISK